MEKPTGKKLRPPIFGKGFIEVTNVGKRVDRKNPPKMPASTVRVIRQKGEFLTDGLYQLIRVS